MTYSSTVWFDFAGSLSIIIVLTVAYGQVHRRLFTQKQGQILLGLAFGGVAWLQMNMPIEPMEGLIIDLRNVPVVLCGAFLGWRAALLCFTMAVGTRYGIGGLGMWAGIAGMTIALGVGILWSFMTRSLPKRGLRHMIILSLGTSAHLGAAVLLPETAQTWFFANAVVPISIMNLVSITLAAYLLDAENSKILREDRLAAAAICDPDHGALTRPAFEREIQLRVNAGTMMAPVALMVVKMRHSNALYSIIPSPLRGKILGLIRIRLKQAFSNADLVCSLGSTALVVPLNADQFLNKRDLQENVMSVVRSEPFQVTNDSSKLIAVDTKVFTWAHGTSLNDVLRSINLNTLTLAPKLETQILSKMKVVKVKSKKVPDAVHIAKIDLTTIEGLFSKATFLMKSGHVS